MIEIIVTITAMVFLAFGGCSLYGALRARSRVLRILSGIDSDDAGFKEKVSCKFAFTKWQEEILFGYLESASERNIIGDETLNAIMDSISGDCDWLIDSFDQALNQMNSSRPDEVLLGCEKIYALGDRSCLPFMEKVETKWVARNARVANFISQTYKRMEAKSR